MVSPSPPAPFAAFRQAGYGGYFVATALTMMADNIEHVISYWVLYEKFHSPALGGIAIVTHWLPFLLFSVYSGSLADRFQPRRIIQAAQLLFMLVSLAWGALFLTDSLQVWQAVVLLTLHGFAGVLWQPASQMLVHHLVGGAALQSGVRLSATALTLGILLGPALGGGLLLALGPGLGIIVNALVYCVAIGILSKRVYAEQREHSPIKRPRFADIVAAARGASANRTILSMIVLAGTVSFFVGNAFQAQMPEFASDLGTANTDRSYSVLLTASAAGAVLGGLILEARGLLRPSARTAFVLALLWCVSIIAFAATKSYPVAVVLMFTAGFLNLAFSAMAQTLVQVHAPPDARGRIIGLFNMSANGLRAFSGVTVGVLGSLIGIHWSLALSALVLLSVIAAMLGVSVARR